MPLFFNPEADFRPFALTQYARKEMAYSIRTKEWRYTEYVNKKSYQTIEQELYRINDKTLMEEENVEGKYPNVVKEMSKMLHDYIKTAPKWNGPQIPKK